MLRNVRLAVLLLVGALLGGCPNVLAPTGTPPDGTDGGTGGAGEFPDCTVPAQIGQWGPELIQRINDERARFGLDPLVPNDALAEQANIHACDMIHYNFFDHNNPVTGTTPSTRVAAAGFAGNSVGENIGAGEQSPAQVMADWVNSPQHEANIISPAFTDIGVGVRQGGLHGIYWTVIFAGP